LLAEMRTDLDTFTEVEAYALMASGYLMTGYQLRELDEAHKASGLKGSWSGFDVGAGCEPDWPFECLLPVMSADPEGTDKRTCDLARQLKASRMLFGKVWVLVPALSVIAILLAIIGLGFSGSWIYRNWQSVYTFSVKLSVSEIIVGTGVLLMGVLLPLGKFIKPLDTFRKWLFMAGLAIVGCVAANLHLYLFDPIYKSRGRLARLMKLPSQ